MRKLLYALAMAMLFAIIGFVLHVVQYMNKYHNDPIFMKPSLWNFKKVWAVGRK